MHNTVALASISVAALHSQLYLLPYAPFTSTALNMCVPHNIKIHFLQEYLIRLVVTFSNLIKC